MVAFPTDTLYGLAANPYDPDAVAAVFSLKGRSGNQPLPLVAADVDQVSAVAAVDPVAMRLAREFWPGPLTLLLRSRATLATGVGSADGLVGIRVPDSEIARALARSVGHPVTATSANRSDEPPTADPDVVASNLQGLQCSSTAATVAVAVLPRSSISAPRHGWYAKARFRGAAC